MSHVQRRSPAPVETGLHFGHVLHAELGLECDMCHTLSDDGRTMSLPGHPVCGMCHEIPEDFVGAAVQAAETGEDVGCGLCHARDDYSVDGPTPLLSDELRFAHSPHTAREITCAECHGEDPDERPLADRQLKPFCMDCHGAADPALNECSVCHSVLDTDVRPSERAGKRLIHDIPEIWMRVHGRETHIDSAFCGLCHAVPGDCESCHQTTPPDDHTFTWRRRTHGLKASWDRNRCAVCHEEDSCMRCHQSTKPSSHRGAWGSPINRHCASCHYPANQTSCVVCHKRIEHRSAMPSPHTFALYPPQCNVCHPGGMPNRAPHLLNSTTRCAYCHQ